MVRQIYLTLIVGLIGMLIFTPSLAQETPQPPLNVSTDDFIRQHFLIQTAYQNVICVSGSGDCVTEITTAPPCFTDGCSTTPATYAISQQVATLQEGVDAARAGDLVIVMPGEYAGIEVEGRGGEDNAYIHIMGYGERAQIIVNRPARPDVSWLRHHFYFVNAHHFIISNMTFAESERGAGVFLTGYFQETGSFSHHFIVDHIIATDNYEWGLHTTSTNTVLIQDSVFLNSEDEHGVYVSGSGDDFVIRRNIFQGNTSAGLQINADPQTATMEIFYYLQNQTGDTCGWSEEDVEFEGAATWHDLFDCYQSQGMPDLGAYFEDGISENIIVEQNVATGNGEAGGAAINLAAVHHITIRSNLLYGNGAAGIACWDNGYIDEKPVDESPFGCAGVSILNNTIVDESGNRGGLILTHFAQDVVVANNIIIRDRYDAFEVAFFAGEGISAQNNYFSALYVEDNAITPTGNLGISDFSVAEGLAQFENPTFAPWWVDGAMNPNAPSFAPRTDSVLATGGDPTVIPTTALNGAAFLGTEIGALPIGSGTVSAGVDNGTSETPSVTTTSPTMGDFSGGFVLYSANGRLYLMEIGGATRDLTTELNALANGVDNGYSLSPNAAWILLDTERFDPRCVGWSCLVLLSHDLQTIEVIETNGDVLHGNNAIVDANANIMIYQTSSTNDRWDLFMVRREGDGWSAPLNLSAQSPYPYNDQPALSFDNARVVFDCGVQPYAVAGTAICEVNTDGTGFRVLVSPEANGTSENALHHPYYRPDGSIVFEANWGNEQLWTLSPLGIQPLAPAFGNDNSPCVLPNGNIVSLWLDREGGRGYHEIKIMTPDGRSYALLLTDVDVLDNGTACGG